MNNNVVFYFLALLQVSLWLTNGQALALRQKKEPYQFKWSVKDDLSRNDFGHQESYNGISTRGSYFVFLPDGRLQRVSYRVHKDTGFVAKVTYERVDQNNPKMSRSSRKFKRGLNTDD